MKILVTQNKNLLRFSNQLPYYQNNYSMKINKPTLNNINNINIPQANIMQGNYLYQVPINVVNENICPNSIYNPQLRYTYSNNTHYENKLLPVNKNFIPINPVLNSNITQNTLKNQNTSKNQNTNNVITNKILINKKNKKTQKNSKNEMKKTKEKENYIEEIRTDSMVHGISHEHMNILLEKMEKFICKIKCDKGGFGTGFFCNIPLNWNNSIKVIMTNNHVLNEDDIKIDKIIKFSINNEKENYEIRIDESREKYTNEKYDITIIEIKEEDNLDINSFFEIDKKIFIENNNKNLKNKQINLLHYGGGKMKFSPGKIINIYENYEENYTLDHNCDSEKGSSGGPLINSDTFLVIGIHKGGCESLNSNKGIFLKEPIEKFKNEINNKEKNIKKNNIENINELKKESKIIQKEQRKNIIKKILNGLFKFFKGNSSNAGTKKTAATCCYYFNSCNYIDTSLTKFNAIQDMPTEIIKVKPPSQTASQEIKPYYSINKISTPIVNGTFQSIY